MPNHQKEKSIAAIGGEIRSVFPTVPLHFRRFGSSSLNPDPSERTGRWDAPGIPELRSPTQVPRRPPLSARCFFSPPALGDPLTAPPSAGGNGGAQWKAEGRQLERDLGRPDPKEAAAPPRAESGLSGGGVGGTSTGQVPC